MSNRAVGQSDVHRQSPLLLKKTSRHISNYRGMASPFRNDDCYHANINPEGRPSCVILAFCLRPVKS